MKHIKGGRSKISLVILCTVILMNMLFLSGISSASQATFKDVPESHWAYGAVENLADLGIVKGFEKGLFKPDAKVSREQFSVLLARALNLPLDERAPQIFSDIERTHWAFLYVDAIKSFLLTPTNPTGYYNFNWKKVLTREEAANAIALAMDLHKSERPDKHDPSGKIKDFDKVIPHYRKSVVLINRFRLMTGDTHGNFNPNKGLTRAELCVALNNLVQNKKAIEEALKPLRKPWTIEFINFERPDKDMVRDFPGYNELQKFYGTVISKVYGFENSHLIVQHTSTRYSGNTITADTKTVHVYVYERDLDLFREREGIIFCYDRDNNITDYEFQ